MLLSGGILFSIRSYSVGSLLLIIGSALMFIFFTYTIIKEVAL